MDKSFWNRKYEEGGISGRGSIGIYRNWKWNKIQKAIGLDYSSLIDVGCGDLRFFDHPAGKRVLKSEKFKYTGIDNSDVIIKRNQIKYPLLEFRESPSSVEIPGLRGQVVFCLDLLFHLMTDAEFELTLENCCQYTNEFLIIYNWKTNPFGPDRITDGESQYFRDLSDYVYIFNRNDLRQIVTHKVPYDPYGQLYIFRRDIY